MFYLIAGAVAAYALYQLFLADNRDHSQVPPPDVDSPVEPYTLRARAKQQADLMAQCYQQSQRAYQRRDHALAKARSDQGKRHEREMEKLNAKASATIFKEQQGNVLSRDIAPLLHSLQNKAPSEVDLHGLYVKEAIAYSEKAIADARRRREHEVRLIVGQGNHSESGVSRLKPSIQSAMQTHGHRVDVDPKNPGVLLVRLGGRV